MVYSIWSVDVRTIFGVGLGWPYQDAVLFARSLLSKLPDQLPATTLKTTSKVGKKRKKTGK
jgi:hypothetical protein